MDLKDFVKETLIEISQGVKEAQSVCLDYGALINPMLSPLVCNEPVYCHDDKDYPATSVTFNVALSESGNSGSKTGIGVFLGKISVGKENEKGITMQTATNISFSVNIVLPYIERTGKHIPLNRILG